MAYGLCRMPYALCIMPYAVGQSSIQGLTHNRLGASSMVMRKMFFVKKDAQNTPKSTSKKRTNQMVFKNNLENGKRKEKIVINNTL